MNIEPDKAYSLRDVQKFAGIKSRQYLVKYIDEGFLQAIPVGEGKSRRYTVMGEWIISFMDRYQKGLVKKFSIDEVNSVLKILKDYCAENGIKTIGELEKEIKKTK